MNSQDKPHKKPVAGSQSEQPSTESRKRIPRHLRDAFSMRLKDALRGARIAGDSPTLLARAFSQSHLTDPITTQTATNWLNGTVMPTETKTMALAEWLGVGHDWLRHGRGTEPSLLQRVDIDGIMPNEVWLLEKWRSFPPEMQMALREVFKVISALGAPGMP